MIRIRRSEVGFQYSGFVVGYLHKLNQRDINFLKTLNLIEYFISHGNIIIKDHFTNANLSVQTSSFVF